MSRFAVLRRTAFVLALAPLIAAGVAAAAAPKAGSPKSSPSTSPTAPKLEPVTAAKMALIPPATKEIKAAVARAGGFQIDPGDVKTATRMTVRQPNADAYTSLAFVRPEGVMPRGGDGIAAMNPSLAEYTLPYIDGLKIMRGDFSRPVAVTPVSVSSMGVVFRATANRSYVVTCTYAGQGTFQASVIEGSDADDATSAAVGASTESGHVGALVLAAPRLRDLTVQFTSNMPWTSSACEITPVG